MSEKKIMRGTPPSVSMKAKNYKFEVSENNFIIKIPKEGSYYDLDPTFFKKEDGDFNIFNEETKTFYMPAITKVLFAKSQYPDLPEDHYFTPIAMQVVEDGLVIIGQVIKIFSEKESEEG